MNDADRYNDIIDLPHHRSDKFPPMPLEQRAAQFSPFAALRGYDDCIEEAQRFVEARRSADDFLADELNESLVLLRERASEHPRIAVTWFKADERKAGGAYCTLEGRLKKLDEAAGRLLMEGGEAILFGDIVTLSLCE